jgi:putative membrane protein
VIPAFVSALHLLSFGVGLPAVFLRGRHLRELPGSDEAVRSVLRADDVWGLAALGWLSTGLARLFLELDKGLDFYLYNGFFWAKMALFGAIFLLELRPMATFLRWRLRRRRGQPLDLAGVPALIRLHDLELLLHVPIPFAAALMARGVWLLP